MKPHSAKFIIPQIDGIFDRDYECGDCAMCTDHSHVSMDTYGEETHKVKANPGNKIPVMISNREHESQPQKQRPKFNILKTIRRIAGPPKSLFLPSVMNVNP